MIKEVWWYLFSPVRCHHCDNRLWIPSIDGHSCKEYKEYKDFGRKLLDIRAVSESAFDEQCLVSELNDIERNTVVTRCDAADMVYEDMTKGAGIVLSVANARRISEARTHGFINTRRK